jgi:RND superfamily putative drug exporter
MTPEGWSAYTRTTDALAATTGAAGARSLTTIGNRDLFGAQNILPKLVVDTYLSGDKHAALVTVIPDSANSGAALTALVRRVRSLDAEAITNVRDVRLLVAGLPAYALDYETTLVRSIPVIVVATSVATFVALLIAFRAPLVALKAVVLNLLVAAAAIGGTALVFHDAAAIFPTVPVLAFGAAFGTSMDYELFLLGGILDARRGGADDRQAIVLGLARTGGLITRAAAVMACLFIAFSTSALLPVAMVGTTLAIAVVLDATLVRLALAPAILAIAGRWNWWPGRIDSAATPPIGD